MKGKGGARERETYNEAEARYERESRRARWRASRNQTGRTCMRSLHACTNTTVIRERACRQTFKNGAWPTWLPQTLVSDHPTTQRLGPRTPFLKTIVSIVFTLFYSFKIRSITLTLISFEGAKKRGVDVCHTSVAATRPHVTNTNTMGVGGGGGKGSGKEREMGERRERKTKGRSMGTTYFRRGPTRLSLDRVTYG